MPTRGQLNEVRWPNLARGPRVCGTLVCVDAVARGRMPDSQSRKPWFKSHFRPFRSLAIFVLSMTPQVTKLYKWVPCYRQWWKYEWIVFGRKCSATRVLPWEVELVPEWTGQPGGEVLSALSGPTDWILRYLKICIYLFYLFSRERPTLWRLLSCDLFSSDWFTYSIHPNQWFLTINISCSILNGAQTMLFNGSLPFPGEQAFCSCQPIYCHKFHQRLALSMSPIHTYLHLHLPMALSLQHEL